MRPTRRPVLVTDGEQRPALAVVRSLGRAGYPVYVASHSQRSLAGASRYARGREVVVDPSASPAQFAEEVRAVIRRRDIGVVVPIADPALLVLTSRRADLGDVAIPWPDVKRVRRAADKALVTQVAREAGIRVPAQRLVATPEEALSAARELRFPLVLKPSRSVREDASGRLANLAVSYAGSANALRARVAELPPPAFPLLLQERVVGPGIGVSCLLWDGRLLARFAHRRLRERPPAGGVSVYAESIAPDERLVERSVALLRRLEWHGVAMVEYKFDAASGEAYLMEINGRFWGSLQLAVDAGVDFPALLVDAAEGHATASGLPDYRVGVRFRWWWGDIDHLVVRLMRPADRLSLPPDAPSRLKVVRDFLAAGPPHRHSDAWRRDDPRPFIVDTADWLRGHLSAVLRSGPRRTGETPSTGERATAASPVG